LARDRDYPWALDGEVDLDVGARRPPDALWKVGSADQPGVVQEVRCVVEKARVQDARVDLLAAQEERPVWQRRVVLSASEMVARRA